MAAFIQVTNAIGSFDGNAATYPANVTAGNLLVASINTPPIDVATYTLTDSQGNVWKKAINGITIIDGTKALLFWTVAGVSGPNTVTIHQSAPGGEGGIIIAEYSGANNHWFLGPTNFGVTNTAISINSGNLNTTQNNALLLVIFTEGENLQQAAPGVRSYTGGFVERRVCFEADANESMGTLADNLVNVAGVHNCTVGGNLPPIPIGDTIIAGIATFFNSQPPLPPAQPNTAMLLAAPKPLPWKVCPINPCIAKDFKSTM